MKAYKVFNPDWTCINFQYKVGETYSIKEDPKLCSLGFHACKKAVDCFDYYKFDPKNKVAEVELLGKIKGLDDNKQVTNKIKIIREILWCELLELVNTGKGNTGKKNSGYLNSGDWNSGYRNSGDWNSGYRNSGDWNSGYRNSGDRNSGYRNSGDRNSGDWNSGYLNSGDRNSGDRNSGYRNSGDLNSGDRNSGDWNSGYRNSGYLNSGDWNSGYLNSGDRNSGYLNSKSPAKSYAFNKLLEESELQKILHSKGFNILMRFKLVKYRVRTKTGKYGDYRYISYKKSWKYLWSTLSIQDKIDVSKIPHFDKDVFFEITGIKVIIIDN